MTADELEKQIVYAVARGEYSDYGIRGIFSTREKAEAFIAAFGSHDFDLYFIEEYELDCMPSDGCRPYHVYMADDGSVVSISISDYWYPDWPDTRTLVKCHNGTYHTMMWARDSEHATKIAAERRAEYLAQQGVTRP